MVITAKTITEDYNKLKKIVGNLIIRNKFERACFFMRKAATLMYNANICFADDELEQYLNEISFKVLPAVSTIDHTEPKRIVLYDYFVLDNRGLTEQYLNGLLSLDYDLYFVGCRNDEKSKEIISKLESNNVKTYIIENDHNEIRKTELIYRRINEINPSVIIAHTAPWDMAGLMAINRCNNCRKYLINITDHAFWLGKSVFDYFFEFRDYGCNISKKYRGIPEEKLLKLPYYPIINKDIQFQGFDFETEGKRVIFSGGSIYKIKGSNAFFEIVKFILLKYPDTVFLYLGNGDTQYLHDFVKNNNLQNRFYYRPERKDIYEVFKHCYLYLNTYPHIGALMTQYACVCGKVPLTLKDKESHGDDIYELLLDDVLLNIQFNTVEELKEQLDLYMSDSQLVENDGKRISRSIISEKQFSSLLSDYLNQPKNKLKIRYYDLDEKICSKHFISRFNENRCVDYYKLFCGKKMMTTLYFLSHQMNYFFALVKNSFKTKFE